MNNQPIGIFDSGVGGLTVVSQIVKKLPNEAIVYFGDTARVPYGSRSVETIMEYSMQSIQFLVSQNVKAVVIACNTVSSTCLERLKDVFDIPLISVVDLQVGQQCVNLTKTKRVGVIGTERTIKSNIYEKLICGIDSEIKVFSKACPLFVPLAEELWHNNEVTKQSIIMYLDDILSQNIDTILLGCTHYPLLADCIKSVAGTKTMLVDPGKVTASILHSFLIENDMQNESTEHENKFFVSDKTEKFDTICRLLLNKDYVAKKIDIV